MWHLKDSSQPLTNINHDNSRHPATKTEIHCIKFNPLQRRCLVKMARNFSKFQKKCCAFHYVMANNRSFPSEYIFPSIFISTLLLTNPKNQVLSCGSQMSMNLIVLTFLEGDKSGRSIVRGFTITYDSLPWYLGNFGEVTFLYLRSLNLKQE